MTGVREVILPIFYFNNSVTVDASTAKTMKSVLTAMKAVPFVSVALVCIGTVELVVAICWILTKKNSEKKRRKRARLGINNENEPLLTAGK